MRYYTDLFTPETWDAFRNHGSTISGFRERQRKSAERIQPGDRFLCYLVRLSRWCGILEVTSNCFSDSMPIFSDPDPFVIRFHVRPVIVLDVERSIPIFEPGLWSHLSMTKSMEVRSLGWAQHAKLRSSLIAVTPDDAGVLVEALTQQAAQQREFPLTAQDQARLGRKHSVRTVDREVIVEVPDEDAAVSEPQVDEEPREDEFRLSHRVQASIARIGAEMGFRIWVPRNDRQKVLEQIPDGLHEAFLDVLPLNYDDVTLKTVEQIDVIWLRNRSMARAFEVEHTTAIYSGILRMAGLAGITA